MGKPLGLTLRPRPRGYAGRPPPSLLVLKIVPSLTELSIFQIAPQQKDLAPLAKKMGPILLGPTLLSRIGTKKSPVARRTLRLRNLSPAQPPPHGPTFTSNVNAKPSEDPLIAARERTVFGVGQHVRNMDCPALQ